LGKGISRHRVSQEICSYLQAQALDVYFFMPPWLDHGKELLPYMLQILEGLGLDRQRIRVIVEPVIFSTLLVPAQVWGFDLQPGPLDQEIGCDSRALMRSMLAGFQRVQPAATAPRPTEPAGALKVYVTRTALDPRMGRPIGDSWLDEVMQAAGYLVFSPEQHSIDHQVRMFSEASDLIFIDGSALYILWLAKLRPRVRITMILRRRQGLWLAAKVKQLLPASQPICWRTIDAVLAERLTSEHDWLSQNLLDLGLIARQLLAPRPVPVSFAAGQALVRDLQGLTHQLEPEAITRVLEALFRKALVPDQDHRGPILRRLRQRIQRMLRSRQQDAA